MILSSQEYTQSASIKETLWVFSFGASSPLVAEVMRLGRRSDTQLVLEDPVDKGGP